MALRSLQGVPKKVKNQERARFWRHPLLLDEPCCAPIFRRRFYKQFSVGYSLGRLFGSKAIGSIALSHNNI
jgi:hypothetical protein